MIKVYFTTPNETKKELRSGFTNIESARNYALRFVMSMTFEFDSVVIEKDNKIIEVFE